MDECAEQADSDAVLRAAVPAEEGTGTAQHAAALSAHRVAHAAARKAAMSNHIPISSVYNHASMICDGVASFIQPIMATGGKLRFRRSCCWPCLGIDFRRALAEADRRNSGRCHRHWHARPSQGAPSPASLSTVAGRALQLGLRVRESLRENWSLPEAPAATRRARREREWPSSPATATGSLSSQPQGGEAALIIDAGPSSWASY